MLNTGIEDPGGGGGAVVDISGEGVVSGQLNFPHGPGVPFAAPHLQPPMLPSTASHCIFQPDLCPIRPRRATNLIPIETRRTADAAVTDTPALGAPCGPL